jgi:hypothetical protein
MDTVVVNVRVEYIRPEYANLAEWCNDPNNVYIGRRGIVYVEGVRYPHHDSPFANPYKIGKNGDRDNVLALYRGYIYHNLRIRPELVDTLRNMKGKKLGCWCKPAACHGDILVEIINSL